MAGCQIPRMAITVLLAIALYVLFCLVEWALSKVERWWNKRKENHR